jgi:hypothetical protein
MCCFCASPLFTKVSVSEILHLDRIFLLVCFDSSAALDVARFLGLPAPLSCGYAFYVESGFVESGLIKHDRRQGTCFLCTSFLAASTSGGQ